MEYKVNLPDDWSDQDRVNLSVFLKFPEAKAYLKKIVRDTNFARFTMRLAVNKSAEEIHGHRNIEEAITSFRVRDTQSSRLVRQLRNSKVNTLGELSKLTRQQFLRLPNLGGVSLQLADGLLRHYGFDSKWEL